jgi:hypothetical protein
MVDSHTVATFAFAQLRRDPSFGPKFPWIRNTVVCVESDLATDVIEGMAARYFPDGSTLACYYPAAQRFMFIQIDGPHKASTPEAEPRVGVAHNRFGAFTVGMLVDAVYAGRTDWDDLPAFGQDRAEVSTAEVEKHLSLA